MGRGFTLIELMIVIAIIAIIAAIAIPNLLEARVSANESSAVQSLRIILTSQTIFRESDRDRDFISDFATTMQELSAANLIDSSLGTGTKSGYLFTMTNSGNHEFVWECHADPISPGKSGNRYFYIDQAGILRFARTGPAESTDPPASQ